MMIDQDKIFKLDRDRQVRFMCELINRLTVLGRSYYDSSPAVSAQSLTNINEIVHHVSGAAATVAANERVFDSSLFASVVEAFAELPDSLQRGLAKRFGLGEQQGSRSTE